MAIREGTKQHVGRLTWLNTSIAISLLPTSHEMKIACKMYTSIPPTNQPINSKTPEFGGGKPGSLYIVDYSRTIDVCWKCVYKIIPIKYTSNFSCPCVG
uniref:Uncharacterized protein n=1 Tax=Oryza punctata TaxID=4537 RepID=A0A0E0LW55_ORYPU